MEFRSRLARPAPAIVTFRYSPLVFDAGTDCQNWWLLVPAGLLRSGSWMVIAEKTFSLAAPARKPSNSKPPFWSGRKGKISTCAPAPGRWRRSQRVFASAAREGSDAKRGQPQPARQAAAPSGRGGAIHARGRVDRELGQGRSGLGVLATIGSAFALHWGLFGTRCGGIMNGLLQYRGPRQDTSLRHRSRARLPKPCSATGMGLVAANPGPLFSTTKVLRAT